MLISGHRERLDRAPDEAGMEVRDVWSREKRNEKHVLLVGSSPLRCSVGRSPKNT
jgi:hypothetical protein